MNKKSQKPIREPPSEQTSQLASKRIGRLQSLFKLNLKQLLFAILMGSAAFAVRNAGLFVIVYPPFRIDPRWIFSLLGACWTGPVGGLITGVLAAWKPPYPLVDLACIPIHFVVGLISIHLFRREKRYLLSIFLWPILGVPSYLLAYSLFYSRPIATVAVIYAPILAFIGGTTSILAFIIGLAVDKRAKTLLNFLRI